LALAGDFLSRPQQLINDGTVVHVQSSIEKLRIAAPLGGPLGRRRFPGARTAEYAPLRPKPKAINKGKAELGQRLSSCGSSRQFLCGAYQALWDIIQEDFPELITGVLP
jgi:hypothetical protein